MLKGLSHVKVSLHCHHSASDPPHSVYSTRRTRPRMWRRSRNSTASWCGSWYPRRRTAAPWRRTETFQRGWPSGAPGLRSESGCVWLSRAQNRWIAWRRSWRDKLLGWDSTWLPLLVKYRQGCVLFFFFFPCRISFFVTLSYTFKLRILSSCFSAFWSHPWLYMCVVRPVWAARKIKYSVKMGVMERDVGSSRFGTLSSLEELAFIFGFKTDLTKKKMLHVLMCTSV